MSQIRILTLLIDNIGNVTLRDVNLRPDELNDFFAINGIPFTLKAGFASKLGLTVSALPLTNPSTSYPYKN